MPRNLITALANPLRPGPKNQTVAPRFYAFVEKVPDGCWMWCGYVMPNGYGTISIEGRPHLAHRVSWELHHGPIPEGMQVLHNCPDGENRDCVNPDHLFLGTAQDNMTDMAAKGRSGDRRTFYGAEHHSAKLTADDVREIRRRAATGTSRQALATEYGVSSVAVSKIILRKTWKDIDPDDEVGARVTFDKITQEDADAIRAAYASGNVTQSALARRYGIGPTTVWEIIHGEAWRPK